MDESTDEHGRIEPDVAGDEWTTLTEFLDYQRATFAWKVAGLDAAQLARPLPPSTMTLAGLMKHLAYVEDDWFDGCLLGEPRREPWASVDWAATPDWEWDSAIGQDPAELHALWDGAVMRARSVALTAYETGGLGQKSIRVWRDGRSPSLRWILTHLIEETPATTATPISSEKPSTGRSASRPPRASRCRSMSSRGTAVGRRAPRRG